MADQTGFKELDEISDDDVAKIAQQVPGITSSASIKQATSTQKILKGIGSESEKINLTSSKIRTANVSDLIHSNKSSNHDTERGTGGNFKEKSNISSDKKSSITNLNQDNDKIISKVKQVASKDEEPPTKNMGSFNSNNQRDNSDKTQTNAVVPESMYNILQQRAQNVLKMIGEKKGSEIPVQSSDKGLTSYQAANSESKSPSKTSQEKYNENANPKSLKPSSYHGSKELLETKSSNKFMQQNHPAGVKSSINKRTHEQSPNNVLKVNVSQLLRDGISQTDNVALSESQQSAKSTEQCTTDYTMRNRSGSVIAENKLENVEHIPQVLGQKMTENTVRKKGSISINQESSQNSAEAVLKELSQIIQAEEVPEKLSKKGEIISYFFKQRLLSKLEATGNLDLKSAELVNATAIKFAKWMEDILKEIDSRKKDAQHEKQTSNYTKVIKEEKDQDEDEYLSATSSKDSLHQKDELSVSQHINAEEKPEIVKIQEISESELIQKFGSRLEDETKYEVFHFVGPDQRKVEVKHMLSSDTNVKVMVVMKKISDTQSSNWVVEVGPDVTLENLSGTMDRSVFDGNTILFPTPPQTEPSAPQEP